MFLAVLSCFTHWAFHWQEYFFGDEYKIRLDLTNAGHDDNEINRITEEIRSTGFFGPVSCSTEGCQARIE